jgi:hypothetical protein
MNPMLQKNWMGLINLECDVLNGITQGWVCPNNSSNYKILILFWDLW